MQPYLETLTEPWNYNDIETAIFRSFTDALKSINNTEGAKLWRSLRDLGDTLWIYETNTTELLDEICLFSDRSKNPNFWRPSNDHSAEKHTLSVKRKLFHCTSAIMTLVDHARNFQRSKPVEGYSEQLRNIFGESEIHDFLQCLRNYNTHWRIAQANWIIESDAEKREARFSIKKIELLRWDGWTAPARVYLQGCAETVDVYQLFSNYRTHVQTFYSWHKAAVLDHYGASLQTYLQYKRLYDGIQKKSFWNMIVSSVPATLNPYQYLDRYLDKQQVERLLAYTHRSEEQVDAAIRMLDMDEFCDTSLRAKLLRLFGARP